jgi:Protein of unknown function (DUF2441)
VGSPLDPVEAIDMASEITDAVYFHINKQTAYSPHKLMNVGDVIEAGSQSNPFFRFYETTAKWANGPSEGYNLVRELVWENIRLQEFPDEPSRQRCLWVTQTEDQARAWGGADQRIVRGRATGRVLQVDVQHLPRPQRDAVVPLSDWQERARRYWRGDRTEHFQPEFLFVGTFRVDEIINANAT